MKAKPKATAGKADKRKGNFRRHSGKNEPKKIVFIAGLVLLAIALLGCTQMTRSEKNLCYSLATKSYAYVPVCETEQSCFLKVNEMFKTKFGAGQESALYSIKNHVARSWFFYNKAVTESKNIANFCSAGNAEGLAGEINQTQAYAEDAFKELDAGIRQSFVFVSAEEKDLSTQKIDLAKEEPLYDSLVESRQILAELNTGATNSDSYVSYFLNKAKEFNDSAAANGFGELVENKSFWLEQYDYVQGTILDELGIDKGASFPVMSSTFQKVASELEALFYKKQGISALQQFPISDFMKLYSDLGGNNNSSLKRFADLANRTSDNQQTALLHSQQLWKSVLAKQALAQSLFEQAKKDSKYYALYAELAAANLTTEKSFEERFSGDSNTVIALREKKAKGVLSLGEELSGLKDLNNEFDALIIEAQFGGGAFLQKLEYLCGLRAEEMKKTQVVAANANIAQLADDVKYFAAKTISSSGEMRVRFCEELIAKKDSLTLALEDYSKLEAQEKDSAKDCFSYLDKVFASADLYELKNNYEELKKTEVTKDNLLFFEDACQEIKKQADAELSSEPEAQSALGAYQQLERDVDELESIAVQTDDQNLLAKVGLLKNKLEDYGKYFEPGGINFGEFLPAKSTISAAIGKTSLDAESLLEDVSKQVLATDSNAGGMLESIPVPDANKDLNISLSQVTKKELDSLFEKNKKLLLLLEEQLSQNEKELIQAKIVPPITNSRLTKLELLNNETYNSDKTPDEKETVLSSINLELSDAADYLKKEAVQAFNRAIDLKAEKASLAEAQGDLDQNNYVGALLALSSAASPSAPFDYYQAFIPIALIIIVAFAAKIAFSRKQKEDEVKKSMILEEWKE